MRRPSLRLEDLIYSVIGAFFEVYNTLGYGFLEHLYLKALERELLAPDAKLPPQYRLRGEARTPAGQVYARLYEIDRER